MALSFRKIISENENEILEDLSIESFVEVDLYPTTNAYNALFEDHLSVLNNENNYSEDEDTDNCIFDLDIEYDDLDKAWTPECDINGSFGFDNINIVDFDSYQSNTSLNKNIIDDEVRVNYNSYVNNKTSFDVSKKNSTITRRQSSRIENQTRKRIAEQIQRENNRLAVEAQFLNNKVYQKKKKQTIQYVNGRQASSAIQRYLCNSTDLDADDEEEDVVDNVETTSDDDPNKVWCLCRKPYGNRFMICCDNCLEWYHGDCVAITEQDGADMDEFICPLCEANLSVNINSKKSDEVDIINDGVEDDDHELLNDYDNDCSITKSIEPTKVCANIFQLIKTSQDSESDKSKTEPSVISVTSLSRRTSVCLNQNCKTLVNPKKSLYCSRNCIDKYTKMVIKNNLREKAKQYGLPKGPKLAKMTRFVLAQPASDTIQDEFSAPTEDTLKEFLMRNPTYKVYQTAKPIKSKEDLEKSRKFLELVNRDPSKHIKVVKLFAILFKKFMTSKCFNLEFRNIWECCVKIEEGLFESCDKAISDKYMSKVKGLSEHLKSQGNERLFRDILNNKLSVSDLLSMTKDQFEARTNMVILDCQPTVYSDKSESIKINFAVSKGGISLLSDTTHLHGHHLYDINCKVCNGAQKHVTDTKDKDKDFFLSLENTVSSCTEMLHSETLGSPSNNDEFAVTSSVETPDMVIDMEICSPLSEKDESDSKIINDVIHNNNIDSSSKKDTNNEEIKNSIRSQKRKLTSLWEGNLTYKEVGSVMCKSYLVTRLFLNKDIEKDQEPLPENEKEVRELLKISSSVNNQITINGRSLMSDIQNYLHRLRKHSNKEFLVMRLHPSNLDEEGKIYQSMFEFLHGRERCGVISDKRMGVKDCFIYPLNAHVKIPSIFLPFVGPGLEKRRPHLLLLILVRTPLSRMQYQPISPKYDQDDDFVKKHGINLDKYCQPNQSVPFCPSPIANSNKNVRWVINTKSKDDVKNSNEIKNLTKIQESKPITAKCDIENQIEILNYSQNMSNGTLNIEDSKGAKHELQKSNIESFSDKFKNKNSTNIGQNNVISACDECTSSDIAVVKLCDIPLPDSIPDIVKKDKVIKKIIPKSEDVSTYVAPDLSLKPTPFLYRTLIPASSKINQGEQLNQTIDDHAHVTIVDHLNVTSTEITSVKGTTEDNIMINSALDIDFSGDVDLRFCIPESKEDVTTEDFTAISSENLIHKRCYSSRYYTLYDCFDNDRNSESKRMKYFFNPFSPNTDFIHRNKEKLSFIVHTDDDSKVNPLCGIRRNASVFSPKEIVKKT